MTSLQQTQVDLSGLLEVLGKNLYSTPLVALRELIQNAHDACVRHRIESGSERDYKIQVFTEPGQDKLRIVDNGSGLIYEEIQNFLATIGSGYTRLLRQEEQSAEMIGYFGLGFLSAYVVAERVEVITESYQNPGEAWLFISNGGQRYSVSSTSAREAGCGSEVILTLKPEAKHLADVELLSSILRQYCCLLPIPIFLNHSTEAINAEPAPWHYSGSAIQLQKKQKAFAQRFEHHFEPLCVMPLLSSDLAVQGFLWIQDGSGYASSDFRNVNVFVRHMHITNKAEDLLPKWAGFVGCLLNADCLTPTASREDIQQDENYTELQDLLHRSLVEGLKSLSEQQPENWQRVLRRHNQALLGGAVADDELFESVKNEVTLPTSHGNLKVSAVLRQSQQRFYVQPQEQLSYQGVLLNAQGLPIVSGYLYAATAFCQRYALNSQYELILMGHGEDNQKLFPKVAVSENTQQQLEQLFSAHEKEKVYPSQFKPDFLPLVIVEDELTRLKESIESDEADKRMGSAILGLAREFTQQVDGSVQRFIYVNTQSALVQSLLSLPEEQAQLFAQMIKGYVLALVGSTNQQDYAEGITGYFDHLSTLIDMQKG